MDLKAKHPPKQQVLKAIETIEMFIRQTSYETYIQKELEKIKKIMTGK